MSPRVSIIVPVYNTGNSLVGCLDSLRAQTLRDMEIICVNDGSTDQSSAMLRRYAADDSRFVLVAFSRNRGPAAARNAGMGLARGEYLGFVDSDDTVDAFFYERLYATARETSAEIVKGVLRQIPRNETVCEGCSNALIRENRFAFSSQWTSAIYLRSFIRDNGIDCPLGISNAEDTVFLMKAVALCNKIAVVDDVCYYYRRRDDSLDSNCLSLSKIEAICRAMREIARFANLKIADASAYGKLFLFCFDTCLAVPMRAFPGQTDMAASICAEHLIAIYNFCHQASLLDDVLRLRGADFENTVKRGDVKTLVGLLPRTPTSRLISQLRARIRHA